jgi:hypothetical protein
MSSPGLPGKHEPESEADGRGAGANGVEASDFRDLSRVERSENKVVQEAIAAYLGKTPIASVQSMSKRVEALERKDQKLLAVLGS